MIIWLNLVIFDGIVLEFDGCGVLIGCLRDTVGWLGLVLLVFRRIFEIPELLIGNFKVLVG